MSDPTSLPKYPHAEVANEVGLRSGPPREEGVRSVFKVVYSSFSLAGALAAIIMGVITYLL